MTQGGCVYVCLSYCPHLNADRKGPGKREGQIMEGRGIMDSMEAAEEVQRGAL